MNNKFKLPLLPLVDCQWLYHRLLDNNTCILEINIKSVNQSPSKRDNQSIIPNAKSVNIAKFSQPNSQLPHTMLTSDQFEHCASNYAITNESIVILYESEGVYASPRIWWIFKSMGHKHVYILNSTISQWIELGFPIENIKKRQSTSKVRLLKVIVLIMIKTFFCNIHTVKKAITHPRKYQIIDARSCKRFQGKEAEPRKMLHSGHIPSSV